VPAPPPRPARPPRIGLALGGGAARGFAHIGVIQVLEEAGIRPDLVVGTSAGSLVAALYASGKSGAEMAQLALSHGRRRDHRLVLSRAAASSAARRWRATCASTRAGAASSR
jgi:predicted acylesterase/phospholipase RssA